MTLNFKQKKKNIPETNKKLNRKNPKININIKYTYNYLIKIPKKKKQIKQLVNI